MSEILVGAGFGILGGLARLLVESLKTISFERRISFSHFWICALVIISVGAFSGIILSFGKVLSFLAGYAGLDLIDGYYKAFKKKKIKF